MLTRLWILTSLSLALAGCPQQGEKAAPETPTAPAVNPSKAADQIEQARTIARAKSQARGPGVARVEDQASAAAPDAAAGSEQTELPPMVPFLKMNAHINEIFAIMERHKDDCEKAAAEVEAYADKHRSEMIALSKELNELADALTEEEQAQFRAWTLRTGQQMVQGAMGVMMQFHQKCPEHMQRINDQVRSLSAPPPPAK